MRGITEIECLEFLQGLLHQIGGRMRTFASDKVAVKLQIRDSELLLPFWFYKGISFNIGNY